MTIITVPAREALKGGPAVLPPPIRAVLAGSSQLPASALEADSLLVSDQLPAVPTQRLIVLVPAGEVDEHALARRVWELAASSGLSVLYLALSPDADQVSTQCLRLVNLAALTSYPRVRADTNVHSEKNWSKVLRRTLQPGDLLVCLAADRTPGIFQRQALAKRLAVELSVTVYQLGGLQVKPAPSSHHWLKDVLAWAASITLIALFFWLQVWIDPTSARPQATFLLYLSILVELYGLWKINEWIG
jgi:hypothetical protein